MVKRWVEMEAKSEEREREVRSKEVTLELVSSQKTPEKTHGSPPCSQFERSSGSGRDDLKLSKLWASLVLPLEVDAGKERETEQKKRRRISKGVKWFMVLWSVWFCALVV